jgi:hypothetical protein
MLHQRRFPPRDVSTKCENRAFVVAGKPWVFRYKDLRAWWSNAHYNRPGGVESATPTAWAPKSKPVWFTELGWRRPGLEDRRQHG